MVRNIKRIVFVIFRYKWPSRLEDCREIRKLNIPVRNFLKHVFSSCFYVATAKKSRIVLCEYFLVTFSKLISRKILPFFKLHKEKNILKLRTV